MFTVSGLATSDQWRHQTEHHLTWRTIKLPSHKMRQVVGCPGSTLTRLVIMFMTSTSSPVYDVTDFRHEARQGNLHVVSELGSHVYTCNMNTHFGTSSRLHFRPTARSSGPTSGSCSSPCQCPIYILSCRISCIIIIIWFVSGIVTVSRAYQGYG